MSSTSKGLRIGEESALDSKQCELCNSQPAKYVCPRCGVPYCSLKCYKDESKHLQCSESFYKDCVMEDLKTQQVNDPAAARKMTDALKRFHEEYDQAGDPLEDGENDDEELDSDDDEPLEKRLEGISLDDADEVWKNLTEEERNEFKKFVKSVNIQDVVPEWTPWWMEDPVLPKLVEEIDEDEDAESDSQDKRKINKNQPDIMDNIPPMSSLTRIKPNDFVKRGLANIIASYVWTARLYNGEFLSYDNPKEVSSAFVILSSFLSKDTIFPTFEQALADVSMNACRNPELFDGGPTLQQSLHKDVHKILTGSNSNSKAYILSALTECHKLLSKVTRSMTIGQAQKPKVPENKQVPYSSRITEIVEIAEPSVPASVSLEDNDKATESFENVFSSSTEGLSLVDIKILKKAKRKLHYLLAFANENDVL